MKDRMKEFERFVGCEHNRPPGGYATVLWAWEEITRLRGILGKKAEGKEVPPGCCALSTYDCAEEIPTPEFMKRIGKSGCLHFRETTCIDKCLIPAVKALWSEGIVTLGSCCGHGVMAPTILVQIDHEAALEAAT